MKQFARLVATAAFTALSAVALAGIRLGDTTRNHYDWVNCDGGQGQVVQPGSYLATFLDESSWLCVGDAGCVAGGQPFPKNLVITFDFAAATPVSCRSPTAAGDVSFNSVP